MTTTVRRYKTKSYHNGKYAAKKLPRSVTKQLEKIYFQSRKKAKKHPYQIAGGVLLSLGLASGAYLIARYLRNQ